MARRERLGDGEVARRLDALSGWSVAAGRLHRTFEFRDFAGAFGFMASVAVVAERMGHHPDWSNSYSRVTIDLVTHDAGGLTALDFDLAARISELARGAAAGP